MNTVMEHYQKSNDRTDVYDPSQRRVVRSHSPHLIKLKPRIIRLRMGSDAAEVKMAPDWYDHDNYDTALTNIAYPEGTDRDEERTFDTVARYRAFIGKPQNNFREQPLKRRVDSAEALIVALDDCVKRLGGELSFTREEIAADQTACGIANMSSVHLLVANFIPTAKFSFLIDRDYNRHLTMTYEMMQDFILNFCNGIAGVLKCPKDYVRVTSVEKAKDARRQSRINFGVTTPNREETKKMAVNLQVTIDFFLCAVCIT